MSNLGTCPDCGKKISMDANRCPNCGCNSFIVYYDDYEIVKETCFICDGRGYFTKTIDPLDNRSNILGNYDTDIYEPIYNKIRNENPIEHKKAPCSLCEGLGYLTKKIKVSLPRDRRRKYYFKNFSK
jgi:RecJ-like exonuclease